MPMYHIGDKVVHPMHGAGVIQDIIEKKMDGVVRSYFLLKLLTNNMQMLIPVSSCETIGIRPIVDADCANKVLEAIPDITPEDDSNWNKRYRDNMLHLKSGNLMQVASVVKGLVLRDRVRGLSAGERKMLSSAKQILVSEVALANGECYKTVEHKIEELI